MLLAIFLMLKRLDRTQCVKINNIKNEFIDIPGGLPQGSVIAPFLFMLYLSSYKPRYTTSYPVIFAHDTHLIIDEINNIKIWSESNYLPLNDDKMKLIYFGKNGHKSNIFSEPLILNNLVDNLKILGVHWNDPSTLGGIILITLLQSVTADYTLLMSLKDC